MVPVFLNCFLHNHYYQIFFVMNMNRLVLRQTSMFCTSLLLYRKLPKFCGKCPEERRKLYNSCEAKYYVEVSDGKSFKEYLASELKHYKIVYERIYPNSLTIGERKSLFFTELFAISPFIISRAYYGRTLLENEIIPCYKPIDSNDNTLIFESQIGRAHV